MALSKAQKERAAEIAYSWRSLNSGIHELSIEQLKWLINREKTNAELNRLTVLARLESRLTALVFEKARAEI